MHAATATSLLSETQTTAVSTTTTALEVTSSMAAAGSSSAEMSTASKSDYVATSAAATTPGDAGDGEQTEQTVPVDRGGGLSMLHISMWHFTLLLTHLIN